MTERQQISNRLAEDTFSTERVEWPGFTDRQRSAIRLHFGIETGSAVSVSQIARDWGVSRSTVRTHIERALDKIRRPARALRPGTGAEWLANQERISEALREDPEYQVLIESYSELIVSRWPSLSETDQQERRELLRQMDERRAQARRRFGIHDTFL